MTLSEDILEMVNSGKYLKRSKNVKKRQNEKINFLCSASFSQS